MDKCDDLKCDYVDHSFKEGFIKVDNELRVCIKNSEVFSRHSGGRIEKFCSDHFQEMDKYYKLFSSDKRTFMTKETFLSLYVLMSL